jgi:hypothetical protein
VYVDLIEATTKIVDAHLDQNVLIYHPGQNFNKFTEQWDIKWDDITDLVVPPDAIEEQLREIPLMLHHAVNKDVVSSAGSTSVFMEFGVQMSADGTYFTTMGVNLITSPPERLTTVPIFGNPVMPQLEPDTVYIGHFVQNVNGTFKWSEKTVIRLGGADPAGPCQTSAACLASWHLHAVDRSYASLRFPRLYAFDRSYASLRLASI